MSNIITEMTAQSMVLDNGNIQFTYFTEGKEVFAVQCDAAQVGTMATQLLCNAHASFVLTGNSQDTPTTPAQFDTVIPVSHWFFGSTAAQGQKAAGVRVGNTTIGFAVPEADLRRIGRSFTSASWKVQSASTLGSLFRMLLADFFDDLHSWVALLVGRSTGAVRKRSTALSSWIMGRSFRQFRSVVIAPDIDVPTYDPVNLCIYCGSTVYSEKSGIRRHPLGAEHIIAEGIGGTLELPLSSCQDCEHKTGSIIEGDVLGRMLKAARVHLKLKKQGSGPPPKTLPLDATIYGKEQRVDIPIEDYPVIFYMVAFDTPDIDGAGDTPQGVGVRLVNLKYDQRELFKKYKIGAFSAAVWDNHMVVRMLAKIGHSFAAAELKLDSFSPLLVDLIRYGDRRSMRFIGGAFADERPSEALHELALGYQRLKKKTYVVAQVRLFAKYGGPIYSVVVGDSLEPARARVRRVFSSRISRMLIAFLPSSRS